MEFSRKCTEVRLEKCSLITKTSHLIGWNIAEATVALGWKLKRQEASETCSCAPCVALLPVGTSVLFQSRTFAGPLKSECLCQRQGTVLTGCLHTESLSASLPPPPWACGTSGANQLQQFLLRPSGRLSKTVCDRT